MGTVGWALCDRKFGIRILGHAMWDEDNSMGTVARRTRRAEFGMGSTGRLGTLPGAVGLSPVQQHLDGELLVSAGTVKARLGSAMPQEGPDPSPGRLCSRILGEGEWDPDLVVPDGVEHPQVLAHPHEPLRGKLVQETLPKGSCLWDWGEITGKIL